MSAIPYHFQGEPDALVFLRETTEDRNFRTLVESLPIGVFIASGGRFEYLNPEALRIFGAQSSTDLVGTPILERVPERWRPVVTQRMKKILEERVPAGRVQEEFLTCNGGVVPVEASAVSFLFEGRNGALVFVRDMTSERETRNQIEQRDELVRMTGTLAQVGGWSFNPTTGVGSWTDAVVAIHDLPPGTPIDVSTGVNYYSPESRPIIQGAVDALVGEAKPYDLVLSLVSATGRKKWIRTQGFPVVHDGVVVEARGTMQDVTELHQQQVAIEQERERLAVTLRSIGDGVITTDVEAKVVLMSRSAEEMTGWPLAEAVGRPLADVLPLIHEWTKQPLENPVDQVLREGKIVELANHTLLVNRSGIELVIADSAAPILDRDGKTTGVVLVFRDMTEKQRLAETLQRTQNLEAVGLLAAGIAHDFNNLLSGLFGQMQLAAEKIKAHRTEEAAVNLEKALGVFDRARDLTGQLLTFSKGGVPVRTTFDLGVLVRKTTLFALSGSNVGVKFQIEVNLWPCEGDQNQLAQVLDNLVINARQAMPDGGVVTIRAENREEPAGKVLAVSIRDEGPGIPPEVRARIFDPFFSTKPSGHGLGLATVHSIVQRHEGRVEVESFLGQGTTFTVLLPVGLPEGKGVHSP